MCGKWPALCSDSSIVASLLDVFYAPDHDLPRPCGLQIFLTDPAIHCVPLIDGYFDKESSRGPIGVKEFFLTHTCNDTCKKLGLM